MLPHRLIADATRLTIMLNSRDHVHHHSLATELLNRARHAGLAGATVLRAVEGQGRWGLGQEEHLFGDDAPLVIVMVDETTAIARFVAQLSDIVAAQFLIAEPITAYRV